MKGKMWGEGGEKWIKEKVERGGGVDRGVGWCLRTGAGEKD